MLHRIALGAHSGHRDQSDRLIVITPIGHRDRSEATLASFFSSPVLLLDLDFAGTVGSPFETFVQVSSRSWRGGTQMLPLPSIAAHMGSQGPS